MDVHSQEQRSRNMAAIKSRWTKPELALFNLIKGKRYKFRKYATLPRKPDAVFFTEKIVIFVDGEFWHGKDFDKSKSELSEFWLKKISEISAGTEETIGYYGKRVGK